jgi:hypothetical protein
VLPFDGSVLWVLASFDVIVMSTTPLSKSYFEKAMVAVFFFFFFFFLSAVGSKTLL